MNILDDKSRVTTPAGPARASPLARG